MNSCTRCGRLIDRELSRDEEEGGYGYCDECDDQYHQQMYDEEERLNREGRSLYGEMCGYCGRIRSWDEVSAGGDCRCGGADAYYTYYDNEMAAIDADNAAENTSYDLRMRGY